MMKKSLLAASAVALAMSMGSALAADLPSKKAAPMLPPPPPPPMWTGFYVGLNAGYSWDESNSVAISSGSLAPFNPIVGIAGSGVLGTSVDGFIGGGQIGYNYQFSNHFVVGVEADIQGVAASNGAATRVAAFGPLTSTLSASKSVDYLGTVRGRVGYLITPTLLVYGTGGLAYGQTNLTTGVVQTVGGLVGTSSSAFSDTSVGWTAGGGVEWLFLPKWSAKVEYLYYDLGTVTTSNVISFTGIAAPVATTASSTRFSGHVVRAGVNYHFNLFNPTPAPVVAKY